MAADKKQAAARANELMAGGMSRGDAIAKAKSEMVASASPREEPGFFSELGKDALADTGAMVLGGPAAILGGPLVREPIKGILRGEPVQDAVSEKLPLTDVSVPRGTTETAVGLVTSAVGGAASKGLMALRRVPKIKALGGYLRNIVTKGGTIESQKQAASQLFKEAERLAGDTRVPIDNYMKQVAEHQSVAQNPAAGGVAPEVAQIIKDSDLLAGRPGGAHLSVSEMRNALHIWSQRVDDWAPDPAKQRIAVTMRNALADDLETASGKELGDAARALSMGRDAWRKMSKAKELERIMVKSEDALSLDKALDPAAFARINSKEKRGDIVRAFAGDPDGLRAWDNGVKVAQLLARKEGTAAGWLPEVIPKNIRESAQSLFTSRKIAKIMATPEGRKDFLALLQPGRWVGASGAAARDLAGLVERLHDASTGVAFERSRTRAERAKANIAPTGKSAAERNKSRFEATRKERDRRSEFSDLLSSGGSNG